MKNLLFPHRFQRIGWALFAISMVIGGYILISGNSYSYTLNNIAIIGIIVGAVLVTCSREKVEDEMTQHLRLNSLLVALYINYAVLILCSLLVYDLSFVTVMMYNMFTVLLIFMAVFRYNIWRAKKGADYEE